MHWKDGFSFFVCVCGSELHLIDFHPFLYLK